MKIFISFSTKDNRLLQSFVDHYLKNGLQIKDSEISCTGIENSKPEFGENFKDWIKNKIEQSDLIFLLLSRNYKNSEVCLNEMGAAWVLGKTVIPLIIPPITYTNVGFLYQERQLLKADSRNDLFKLTDEIRSHLGDRLINNSILNDQIEKFINETKNLQDHASTTLAQAENSEMLDESYFKKFLIKNIDYKNLLLMAQPTLSDCMSVFRKDYYLDVYEYYNLQYKSMIKEERFINDLSQYDDYEIKFAPYNEQNNNHQHSGMTNFAKSFVLKTNVVFYQVTFKSRKEENGTSFHGWTYINNRWVLFFKPWKVINLISSPDFDNVLIKIAESLKNANILKDYSPSEIQFALNKIEPNRHKRT